MTVCKGKIVLNASIIIQIIKQCVSLLFLVPLFEGFFPFSAFQQADQNADGCLGIEEFENLLKAVDNKLTSLPCTAQVASQKGKYLGQIFSQHSDIIGSASNLSELGVKQFEYNHMGMFAYIGDDKAVLQFPVIGSFKGLGAMYLWKAAYFNESVTIRTKCLILFDWIKSRLFGRDTSRI
jgi:hypothetical protein